MLNNISITNEVINNFRLKTRYNITKLKNINSLIILISLFCIFCISCKNPKNHKTLFLSKNDKQIKLNELQRKSIFNRYENYNITNKKIENEIQNLIESSIASKLKKNLTENQRIELTSKTYYEVYKIFNIFGKVDKVKLTEIKSFLNEVSKNPKKESISKYINEIISIYIENLNYYIDQIKIPEEIECILDNQTKAKYLLNDLKLFLTNMNSYLMYFDNLDKIIELLKANNIDLDIDKDYHSKINFVQNKFKNAIKEYSKWMTENEIEKLISILKKKYR
ncbi:MAG: hypothetical protein GY830_00030 [Bacteroidetes bacterium]|nr:hypothetical protein [Bacteroidota bacterium]